MRFSLNMDFPCRLDVIFVKGMRKSFLIFLLLVILLIACGTLLLLYFSKL